MPAVKTMNCLQLFFCYPSFKHQNLSAPNLWCFTESPFHKQCISHIPSKDVVDFRKYTHIRQFKGPVSLSFLTVLCVEMNILRFLS